MKQTAIEWLIEKLDVNLDINHSWRTRQYIQQAKEMEKEQKGYSKEEVDNLLNKLLENNMCSHAGDELIEQFKKN